MHSLPLLILDMLLGTRATRRACYTACMLPTCTCVCQGVVVWLNGSPELHAKRVSKDGLEKRPLLADAGTEGDDLYAAALKKVTSMLEDRWVPLRGLATVGTMRNCRVLDW